MRGWLGTTDIDWYRFLAAQGELAEVNFWQPSGSRDFHAIGVGSPFFFKLKKPHYAICGFGVFARFEILHDWLAWECFGVANGAPSFESMRSRIQLYRTRNKMPNDPSPRIGCCLITEPVFFDEDLLVRQPDDWAKNVVTGKTYDLAVGEGARVLAECRERALEQWSRRPRLDVEHARETVDAFGRGVLVRPRLGQGGFRIAVTSAYERACAVTTEHSLPTLEAAHIHPYATHTCHDVSNGLLLRSDIHRLFDKGYVTVTPDGTFRVGDRLRGEFNNGKTYYALDGRKIVVPRDPACRPDRDRLAWHSETVFVG